MRHYDAIVLGMGGVGSAALDQLTQRGARAIGIDRFQPPHDRGSTHGHTRIIRQAYFEHPDYVPLLVESYRLWRELEERTKKRLYQEVGLIEIGPPNGILVPGVLRAAAEHGLNVQSLSISEIEERWPGLSPNPDLAGVFEPAAGYLLVEDCVEAHLSVAQKAGATLLPNTLVRGWTATDRDVRVHTDQGEVVAERMIVTAGAWAAEMLMGLNIPLTVRRKPLFWFATKTAEYDMTGGFPVFLFEAPDRAPVPNGESASPGFFYGFPKLDERGLKIAEHSGGRTVNDPLTVDRSIDLGEKQRITTVLSTWFPNVSHHLTDHAVCLYTMSPDEHFIVDRHPDHSNVVFAAGLSGHGFKFVPVLGRALADLALDGNSALPIGFLSLKRLLNS
jgi:monomeric sarcosine oxidase